MKLFKGLFGILDIMMSAVGLCVMATYLHENKGWLALLSVFIAVPILIGGWIFLLDSRKKPLKKGSWFLVTCIILSTICMIKYDKQELVLSAYAFSCIVFATVSLILSLIQIKRSTGDEPSPYGTKQHIVSIGEETYDLNNEKVSLSIGLMGSVAQFYDDIELLAVWQHPKSWTAKPYIATISYNQIRGCKLNRKRDRDYILADRVSQLYATLTVEGEYGPTVYVNFLQLMNKAPKERSRAYSRCLADADRFVSKVQLIKAQQHRYIR